MTREEMIDAMDAMCGCYELCSNNQNGDCPLYDKEQTCPLVLEHTLSDKEIQGYYDKAFNEAKKESNHPVTHPSHYTQGNIQCIDAMESAFGKEAVATWCKLNSFKYIWRAEHKNGLQDIDKAIWYLNKYKELQA